MSDHRRERDRARKAAERLRKGMVPQSRRTVMRHMGEIAEISGVSLSTLYRHRKAGTLDAFLFAPESVRNKCPHSVEEDADRSLSLLWEEPVEPSVDKNLSIAGISAGGRAECRRVHEKLLSEADAARIEWADFLEHGTPWP